MGNVTATTDGLGNTASFTVEEWVRITNIRKADQSEENYIYDHAGKLLSAIDGENHTVFYKYNYCGLNERRMDAADNTDYFYYNKERNLTKSTE